MAKMRPCTPPNRLTNRFAVRTRPVNRLPKTPKVHSSAVGLSFSEKQNESVRVLVYNVDKWGLSPACSRVLKKEVDGIFHVGVAVHGVEYWFDHQVDSLSLQEMKFAPGFEPVQVYNLGRACLGPEEVDRLVYEALVLDYNLETYDCFHNNCHHFANEVCMRLTGRGVPQWILDHGEQGLCNLGDAGEKERRVARNRIAKIAMASWGRYSKERFVQNEDQMQAAGNVVAANIVLEGKEEKFV